MTHHNFFCRSIVRSIVLSIVLSISLSVINLLFSLAAHAEIVVVGHPSAPVLTKSEAEQIFLGKTRLFPNKTAVKPFDLPETEQIYQHFYQKLANKTPLVLRAYWSRMIFTGSGEPPKTVEDADELKQMITEDPRVLGYLEREDVDESVKILLSFSKE